MLYIETGVFSLGPDRRLGSVTNTCSNVLRVETEFHKVIIQFFQALMNDINIGQNESDCIEVGVATILSSGAPSKRF